MQCEEQIATMLTDFQILLVNAALQDDKFQELRVVEGEVSAVVAELYLFMQGTSNCSEFIQGFYKIPRPYLSAPTLSITPHRSCRFPSVLGSEHGQLIPSVQL